ncbi:O-methyltransferase-domain-containing protein [Cunninghamella echinulata]|nr:O-methyltransferase-domain-containing protein [Cunninghamella echinulata]
MNRVFLNKKLFFHSPLLNHYNKPLFFYFKKNTMRWHSTVTVENSVSNNNDRLRLAEDDYCCDYSTPFPPLIETTLNQVAKDTIQEFKNAHMMNSKTSAKFLSQWIHLLKPRNVLEIGTFTGYSTIAMASALNHHSSSAGGSGSHLYSLDKNPDSLKMAEKYIIQAQLMDKVTLMEGDAAESLLQLTRDKKKFEFIFLDADKGGYINYYNIILDNDLLADNGIIMVDNVLYFGQVHRQSGYEEDQSITPSNNIKKTAGKVAAFNEHVKQDSRVQLIMLPLFDGISIIQKKNK